MPSGDSVSMNEQNIVGGGHGEAMPCDTTRGQSSLQADAVQLLYQQSFDAWCQEQLSSKSKVNFRKFQISSRLKVKL